MPATHADWIAAAVDEHEVPLTRYAFRMTGDIHRARDVVQDVYLKLWQADRRKVESHLAAWLYTVCRNRALDELRKDRRMSELKEPSTHAVELDEPLAHAAERSESVGTAFELVKALPARQQEVLRLKFQCGLSYREIGEVMDLTVSHVGVLIHNAIKSIRARLEPRSGSEGTGSRVAGEAR